MKNILIITTYFPPMAGVGAVRVTKYVKYLKRFNWKPTVITVSEEDITAYDDTLLKDVDSDIEVIRLKLNSNKNDKIGKRFLKALKKQIENIIQNRKIDRVFITGGPFEPLKIAPYIHKKFKIPYIIDLRDPWKLQKINDSTKLIQLKSNIKKYLIGFSERKIFSKALAICTVNNTMTMEYQREYPIMKNKFYTISNGYDPSDYEGLIPKKVTKFSIIYAGKFAVSAGFRDPTNIFKAVKEVNEKGYSVSFIHIGQIEQKVIDIAKEEKVEQYCQFLGRKLYRETLEYCKGANILLVMGGEEKCEQTGKVFDYIGCKRPILVLANQESEIKVVCEQVRQAYCIEKNDVEKIVDTILKLYNTTENASIEDDIEHYTRENLTKQFVEILNKG